MKRKLKPSNHKPRPKSAIARVEAAILELADLLVVAWEAKGAPVGDQQVLKRARATINYWANQRPHRARWVIEELLKPRDERDLNGIKESYRELTSLEYRGATKEKPAPSVTGFSKNRARTDALYPDRWDAQEARTAIVDFNQHRRNALSRVQPTSATTREGRALLRHTQNWSIADYNLLSESLAGNETTGLRTWDQVKLALTAWAAFTADWIEGDLGASVRMKKVDLKAARPARGQSVRVNGEVKWKKRVGRPRKPMPRSPYGPRTPAPQLPETGPN